jgi:hypothetical protein
MSPALAPPSLRRAFLSVVVLLLLAGAALAQAPADRRDNLLDETRRRHELAASKVEKEVRDALLEAQKLGASRKAVERLKETLATVEEDTTLPAGRRDAFVRLLKDRIRVTEADFNAASDRAAAKAAKQAETAGRRAADDRATADEAEVTRTLALIRDLRKEGKTADANRLAENLARDHPESPAAQAARRTTATVNQQAATRTDRSDYQRRFAGAMLDVDRSATPPARDVEFPKDWQKRVAKRTTAIPLTPKEQAIIRSLNSPITANFKDSPLETVIDYIATTTGMTIVVDKAALDDAQVTYETPVRAQAKGWATRTLLRQVLQPFGLTFVVKEEVLQITTLEKAKKMMVTRSYPVSDLVAGLGMFGDGTQFGPYLARAQMQENAKQLIEIIKSTVDPDSWEGNGGAGVITFSPGAMSIVVRQSTEVHAALGNALK